jgi:hypothetical protein
MMDVFINLNYSRMNIYMYHRICDSVVKLFIYIIHIRVSLVGKVVSGTQPTLMCKSANDPTPLIMGMVMLI